MKMDAFIEICLALKWHLLLLVVLPSVLLWWGPEVLARFVSTVERIRR